MISLVSSEWRYNPTNLKGAKIKEAFLKPIFLISLDYLQNVHEIITYSPIITFFNLVI